MILLAGAARLRFERGGEAIELSPGDYLNIPAGARHRVDWTDPEQDTIWLVVFLLRCSASPTEILGVDFRGSHATSHLYLSSVDSSCDDSLWTGADGLV